MLIFTVWDGLDVTLVEVVRPVIVELDFGEVLVDVVVPVEPLPRTVEVPKLDVWGEGFN